MDNQTLMAIKVRLSDASASAILAAYNAPGRNQHIADTMKFMAEAAKVAGYRLIPLDETTVTEDVTAWQAREIAQAERDQFPHGVVIPISSLTPEQRRDFGI